MFAEIMMIEYLCKSNTFNAYISPTFAQGKKVFAELTQLLEGTGIIKKANAQDLKIESVFGSVLKFFSMTKTEIPGLFLHFSTNSRNIYPTRVMFFTEQAKKPKVSTPQQILPLSTAGFPFPKILSRLRLMQVFL